MFFDGRQGQHHRLGTQIHPDKRVGRVGVGRDEGRVLGGESLCGVADLIERCLEVRALLVDRLGVEGLVHFHHRVAVQISFLGDGPRFFRAGGESGLLADADVLSANAATDKHAHQAVTGCANCTVHK
ncbi:hypothetical protein D3C84_948130 [compost metagenome]